MAHARTINTNINQTVGGTKTSIMLDPSFKDKLTRKLAQYEKEQENKRKKKPDIKIEKPDIEIVELNYCLCWGYAKDDELSEFIQKTKTIIENLRAFVEQENNSGKNEFSYTLNVRLFPNEEDTEKVKTCNKLAEGLISDFDIEKWRKTDNARVAASAAFDEFHHGDAKENIDNMLETDASDFIGRHLTFKKEESIKHFITEIKDLLALMKPLASNKHAKEQGVMKKENTYVFVLSEHRLCETFYAVVQKQNANNIGYDSSAYCALAIVPTRLPEVRVGHSEENKNRPNNNLTKSASDMKSDPININTNIDINQNHSHSLPTPYKHKSKSPRSKHGMFITNHLPNSSGSHKGEHRSHSPSSSSSSSDGVSPNGSRTSTPAYSPYSSPTGSRSSNDSSPDSSPSGSRHRFFDQSLEFYHRKIKKGEATMEDMIKFTYGYEEYSKKRGRVKPQETNEQENKGFTHR
jgi:hypothetical protein